MWGEFKRTKIMVLICYSLDLQCIPRTRMLKMLSGHWGMVGTYRGEVSWEAVRSAGKQRGPGSSKRKVASMFLLVFLICGHRGVNSLFLRALPDTKCYLTTSPQAKGPSGSCEAAAKKASCKPLLSGTVTVTESWQTAGLPQCASC